MAIEYALNQAMSELLNSPSDFSASIHAPHRGHSSVPSVSMALHSGHQMGIFTLASANLLDTGYRFWVNQRGGIPRI